MGSYDYRMFLINNGNKLMDLNRLHNSKKNGCGSCKKDTMLPVQTIKECNKSIGKCPTYGCKVTLNDKNGLGQGIKYNETKKNCDSWTTNSPLNNELNCCSKSKDLFNYNGIRQEEIGRVTSPSGGIAGTGGIFYKYN